MEPVSVERLADLAEQRYRDPNEVLRQVNDVLSGPSSPEVDATARWARGLALHELGRLPEAVESYRLSAQTSFDHHLRDCEARARAGLAGSLVIAGDAAGAAEQIDMARAVATPATLGLVEMTYGLVLQRTGRLGEAQVAFSGSLRLLDGSRQAPSVARLRMNRGILRAYQGDSVGAIEDFLAAEQIARQEQLPVLTAMAAHNLGFAYGRRGDLPQALSAFVQAEKAYAALEHPGPVVAVLEADRCEVLLLAGLVAEARQAAGKAVAAVARTGDMASLMECRLLFARSLLAGGAYAEASAEASTVAGSFRAAGRRPWAALADYVAIEAAVFEAEDRVAAPAGLLDRCRDVAVELEQQGWPVEALHVRTFVGRLALASGQAALARSELSRAALARRRGTADLRARAWHANALLLLAEGDRAGAKRSLWRGLGVVEEHQASLGATELRARAASHGSELARLGVSLALEERRPAEALRWAERWRASSLRYPPVLPPDDEGLVADLAELRRVRSQARETALAGSPTEHLQRAAVSLEGAVRRRLLETRGETAHGRPLDVAKLRRALNGRVLVEYIALEGRIFAVTTTRSRSRLRQLAPLAEVEQELAYLMFALRRALREGHRGSTEALVTAAAARLSQLLVAPLRLAGGAPVVLVPTGALHRLPWGCLPDLVSADVTVAPSAALWAQRPDDRRPVDERPADGPPVDGRPGRDGPAPPAVMLVAGPGLPGAEHEVRQLARLYPRALVLSGARATTGRVLEGLGRCDVAHLAAHGMFRADSPLFSSVLLADGPLTVHDLARLPRTAPTVVLASCDAGVSGIELGDELMGTAATLLALGVRSLVAPMAGVPDMSTSTFMAGLHRHLAAGRAPSAALAAARAGPEALVASAFVCIGRDNELLSSRTRT